jgi:MSHA pilin protein MshD
MRRRIKQARGFTLAEVLIASSILSFVTLGIVQAVTAGQARTLDALKRARAQALAEVLLEEILAKPYADPEGATTFGPDTGEAARTDFDNVDDYHGYLESTGTIADHAASLYPLDYQSLERSVSVAAVTNSVADLGGDHTGLQVTVSVNEPGGRVWSVERFVPEPN